MGNEIVQIDYQEANQLAQRFSKQQTHVQAILQSLRQTIQALENGGWMGDAATACFKEFHAEVVPAYTRLSNVLGEGQSTMQGIATLFRQAEEEAAALFRGEFAAAAGGEGGIAQAVGGDNSTQTSAYSAEPISNGKSMSTPPTPPPSELETLIRSLKDRCIDPNVILDAIAKATPEERQAILNDPQLMEYIRISEGTAADVLTAALLEGSLHWPAPSGPLLNNGLIDRTSDFSRWMRGEAGPPNTATGTMNCWEATMYAAYLSGEISESQLRQIHQNAADAFRAPLDAFSEKYGIEQLTEANIPAIYQTLTPEQQVELQAAANQSYSDYYDTIGSALGADNRSTWQAGDQPVAGSIVFFESPDSPLSHVAIATGRITPDGKTEVMSLWTLPTNASGQPVSSMQRTTIEDLEAAMIDADMAPSRISTAPNPGDQSND